MTFQQRTILLITGLVACVVIGTTAVLAWITSQALLADTEVDATVIAGLLAKSAEFAAETAIGAEAAVSEQMVVEATILAQLVAVAEAGNMPRPELLARLRDIVDRSALDEIWVTDEHGNAYLNTAGAAFAFSPGPATQPQAHVFWPLLTGERATVVQALTRRELDQRYFKYVGVRGVDRPRIVQVGYPGDFIAALHDRVGLNRFVDDLVAGGNVIALQIVDPGLVTIAYSAVADAPSSRELSAADAGLVRRVVAARRSQARLEGPVLTVVAPFDTAAADGGRLHGAALVRLPTDQVRQTVLRSVLFGAAVALAALALGAVAAVVLARRVTQPVAELAAAAAAIERHAFEPASLDAVARRPDELGNLARVFQRMAGEVKAREARLQRQVQALRVEIDQVKKARQVEEITSSDYFQQLKQKAAQLRAGLDEN